MNSGTALGLVIAILVIATVSNRGLAKPNRPPNGIGSRVEREPSAARPPNGIGSRVEREPSAARPPNGIGSRVEREPSAARPPNGIGSLKDGPRPNEVNCIRHV